MQPLTNTVEPLGGSEFFDENEPTFSHYADSISVTEGYIIGKPVLAICGRMFVPTRDPKKFPICPICKQLAETLFLEVE